MTYVVTLRDFLPPPRYDAVAWTSARVQECATSTGTFTTLETLALSPLDADPTTPALRNLTTSLATIATDGWYRVIFVDGSANQSAPSDPVQNSASASGASYVSASALKSSLSMTGFVYADDDIDVAIISASRAIDNLCNRRFYADDDANQIRYYTADRWDSLLIDDLCTFTALDTDDGSFAYATSWTQNTHFVLDPLNAVADARPWERINVLQNGGRAFITNGVRLVRVTGKFGWATTPFAIREATTFLASRLLRLSREAPFGVVAFGDQAIRIARMDPNVIMLCGPYARHRIAVA